LQIDEGAIRLLPPLGFFDFVHLEQNAFCTLTDSGTVQEETCLFGVPNVTIRDVTERPETVECGSNYLSGVDEDSIARAVAFVTTHRGTWVPPVEYTKGEVAATVTRILLSYRIPEPSEMAWRADKK
jgi:UDP-N-acetylglucosamine 2-epimerase (non-hydrolysing)